MRLLARAEHGAMRERDIAHAPILERHEAGAVRVRGVLEPDGAGPVQGGG